jgi:hypothetical protein
VTDFAALFRIIGRYAPPPPGVRSPMLWGTEEWLVELFAGDGTVLAPGEDLQAVGIRC